MLAENTVNMRPKKGARALETIFNTWNVFQKEIVHTTSIDSYTNKLLKAWKYLPIIFYEQKQFIEVSTCLWICNSQIIVLVIIIVIMWKPGKVKVWELHYFFVSHVSALDHNNPWSIGHSWHCSYNVLENDFACSTDRSWHFP